MGIHSIVLVRTGYGKATLNVEADTREDAVREALDRAGDLIYSEYAAEYSCDDLPPIDIDAMNQEQLKAIDEKARMLRKELGFSDPGQVLFVADIDFNDRIVVEADGYGGASILQVQGNWPVEFFKLREKRFSTEREAEEAADSCVGEDGVDYDKIAVILGNRK